MVFRFRPWRSVGWTPTSLSQPHTRFDPGIRQEIPGHSLDKGAGSPEDAVKITSRKLEKGYSMKKLLLASAALLLAAPAIVSAQPANPAPTIAPAPTAAELANRPPRAPGIPTAVAIEGAV